MEQSCHAYLRILILTVFYIIYVIGLACGILFFILFSANFKPLELYF